MIHQHKKERKKERKNKRTKIIAAVVTAALSITAGIAIFRGRNTFGNFGQKFINGFKFGKAHRLATKHVRFKPVEGEEGLYDITLFHKGKKTELTKEGGYYQARFKDGKLTLSETAKFNSEEKEKLAKYEERVANAILRHPEFNGKPITEIAMKDDPDTFNQKKMKLAAKALDLKKKPTTEGEQSLREKFRDDHYDELNAS